MNFQLDRTNQQCSNEQRTEINNKTIVWGTRSIVSVYISLQRDSAVRRQLNRLWEHVKWYGTAWHTHSHTQCDFIQNPNTKENTLLHHTHIVIIWKTQSRWPGKMVRAFARWMSKYCETHTEIEQNEKYATAIAIIPLGSTMATTATTATTTRTHYKYNGLNDRNAVRLSVLAHFCSVDFSFFVFLFFFSHTSRCGDADGDNSSDIGDNVWSQIHTPR